MDDPVRDQLCDLLATSGQDVYTTPRVLGMLLRQRCPNAGESVRELEQALEAGCVRTILDGPEPVDEQSLAEELSARSGMDSDRARWAIETWSHALRASDAAARNSSCRDWTSWNKLDVSRETAGGTGSYQRAIWHMVIVGLGGAVGGAGFGVALLVRGHLATLEPWREALEELSPTMQVIALIALGIPGGFAGGLVGWIFGGGQSWTYDAHGGTTLGRLAFSGQGALSGAVIGVLGGLAFLGLIGVMLGALVGAGLGAFLGLQAAERRSRFWTWR